MLIYESHNLDESLNEVEELTTTYSQHLQPEAILIIVHRKVFVL